jgi:antitoxin component YwqK of YwqJK toxin-antitoxin module
MPDRRKGFFLISPFFNQNNMSKILFICTLVMVSVLGLTAQEIKEVDGIFYKDGIPYTGNYITHFDNGQVHLEMKLKKGMKNGKVKIFFEDGQLHEIRSYKNNEMHGKWEMYNNQNIKVSVAGYKNGQKHGDWMIWNDTGNLLYKLQYTNGQKSGTWKSYDASGALINERKY